jgi:predicted metal-dependent phosphoesterase TrpH
MTKDPDIKPLAFHNKAICDFHVHTTHSDGVYAPGEILVSANYRSKLKYLCFTDHHTTKAYDDVDMLKEWFDIELLPGVEISASDYKSLHILGIGMNNRAEMDERLSAIATNNKKQLEQIFYNLKKIGIDLGDDFYFAMRNEEKVSRDMFARELVLQGYADKVGHARKNFVNPSAQAGTTTTKPTAKEAIEFIRTSGGIAMLAHPWYIQPRSDGGSKHMEKGELEKLIRTLKGNGLNGIECLPVNHMDKKGFFKAMASNYNLLESGGSDFHGNKSGHFEIGIPQMTQKHVDLILSAVRDVNEEASRISETAKEGALAR